MKAGGLNHIKTRRLKTALQIPLYRAAGLLTCLWQLGAECADCGNIGKYSDEDIAAYFEWDGQPSLLIDALVSSGFVDRCDEFRLVIHDWHEHAPNYIKDRIKKRGQRKQTTCDKKTGDTTGTVPPPQGTVPPASDDVPCQSQLTLSSQGNSIPAKATNSSPPKLRFSDGDRELAAWMWHRIAELQPNRKGPNLDKWANTIRLIHETDGRPPGEIKALFDWCNRHEFWQTNILSPDTLREKWDDLQLKRTKGNVNRSGQVRHGPGQRFAGANAGGTATSGRYRPPT